MRGSWKIDNVTQKFAHNTAMAQMFRRHNNYFSSWGVENKAFLGFLHPLCLFFMAFSYKYFLTKIGVINDFCKLNHT